jgi:hypothetical protein
LGGKKAEGIVEKSDFIKFINLSPGLFWGLFCNTIYAREKVLHDAIIYFTNDDTYATDKTHI